MKKESKNLFTYIIFAGIIGAIDGTHIEGEFPKHLKRSYCERKTRHTMTLQGTCTAKKIFTNISVGCSGRMHDARVLQNSSICRTIETEGMNSLFQNDERHLLGDSAYPLTMWLMTPYKKNQALNNSEVKYNKTHSKSRYVHHNYMDNKQHQQRLEKTSDSRLDSVLAL